MIFSCFQWGGLLWVPAATRISRSTSPRLLLSGCVLLQAAFTAVFAAAGGLRARGAFFAATFAIRLAQGLVTTTYEVAVTSLLMRSCAPERVGTWVGIQESARGVGLMVGPALGGWLFAAGGFALPFLASACALLLLGALVLGALGGGADRGADGDEARALTIGELLHRPGIVVTALLLCALASALTILDPILGPHEASTFHLGPGAVGLTFSAATIAYAALAPAAGALGARLGNFRTLVLGMGLTACSYLLLGPTRWLPMRWALPESEPLLVGALVLLGVGASSLSCCLPVMLDVTHAAGYETGEVSDVLGGLISLAWTAGALTGPLFGSAAVARLGFAAATSLTGAGLLALTLAGTLAFACLGARGPPRAPMAAAGERGAEAAADFDYVAFPDFPEPPGAAAAAAGASWAVPTSAPGEGAGGRRALSGASGACAVPELGEPLLGRAAHDGS